MIGRRQPLALVVLVFITTAAQASGSWIRGVNHGALVVGDDHRYMQTAGRRRLCVEYDCDLYYARKEMKMKKKSKKHAPAITPTKPTLLDETTEQDPSEEEVETTLEEPPTEEAAATEEPAAKEPYTDANQLVDEVFETRGSVLDEDGMVSTCKTGPPDEGSRPVATVVSFTYQAIVLRQADIQQILKAVEKAMHQLLTNTLLSCDFSNDSQILYTSISTLPQDSLLATTTTQARSEVCQNVANDHDCHLASGGATVYHLPYDPTSQVVDQVSEILTGASLASAHFGLENLVFLSNDVNSVGDSEASDVTDNADNRPTVASTGSGNESGSSRPSRAAIAGGTAAAVVALVVVFAMTLFLIRHKRRKISSFQPFKDDDKYSVSLSDDGSTYASESSNGFDDVSVVGKERADKEAMPPTAIHSHMVAEQLRLQQQLRLQEQEMSHDSSLCQSKSCPTCQATSPSSSPDVFRVTSSLQLKENMKDLSHQRLSGSSKRSYAMENTIVL